MAGGPKAERAPCMSCRLAGRWNVAERYYEGLETDWYRCSEGHESGIDWDESGPPETPLWPPPAGMDPRDLSWPP